MHSWQIHPAHSNANRIASELNIHPIVASILLRKGLSDASQMKRFMEPSLLDLEDPLAFVDMHKAVFLIREAISSKKKILIYGDYDVDGITASSILYPVLKFLGADIHAHLPHRTREGYGLNIQALKMWVEKKIDLLIAVDNGITGFEEIHYLKQMGIGVIIADHHIPKDRIPEADAIISGAVNGKGCENSPLAACGLVFKMAWALLGSLKDAQVYLDLVTLGTVADLAPLEGENRILLKWGLPRLAASKRPGIRALMEVAGINPQFLSYRDIAFGLGPRINACGRMDSPEHAFRLLTTEDFTEARNLAQVLDIDNRQRQRVEADAFKEAAAYVEEKLLEQERHVLVVQSPDWHEGVLGIVAARLSEKYQRPSVVISVKKGVGKGSGRSIHGFSIFEYVSGCGEYLIKFGGHSQACGLGISEANIGDFRKKINALAADFFNAPGVSRNALWIDSEIHPSVLNKKLLSDLEKAAPFGPGNPKPLFLSRGLKIKGQIKKRGKDTMQCWMEASDGKHICEVISFRSFERWQAMVQEKQQFDIVYQPTLKSYNGIESVQLELESWK